MSISVIADSILSTEGETGRERAEQWREVNGERGDIYIWIHTAQVQIRNIISQRIWLQTRLRWEQRPSQGWRLTVLFTEKQKRVQQQYKFFLLHYQVKATTSYLRTVFILWASECVCWRASVCLMLHRSHVKYCVCISAKQSKEQLKKRFLNILLSSQSKSINLQRFMRQHRQNRVINIFFLHNVEINYFSLKIRKGSLWESCENYRQSVKLKVSRKHTTRHACDQICAAVVQ